MTLFNQITHELQQLADPVRAKNSQRFFKTGKGDYGEGDLFLGIKVPFLRKVAAKFKDMDLLQIERLLRSKFHEHRLTALFLLVHRFKKARQDGRQQIIDLYLKNTGFINNWDLVDSSAPYLLGVFLLDKDRSLLYKLVKSDSLWERRIAVLATFAFIKNGDARDALALAEQLLDDSHDLIHKAVGWMLREIGGRVNQRQEEEFLQKHAPHMARTMLRYAIEKFPEKKRQYYLRKRPSD